jgi:xylulokinase
MTVFLGIDVGSSGCKVSAVDIKGNIVGSGAKTYKTDYPQPGWAEQDPEDWYRSTCQAIQECLREGSIDPKEVAAISFDGPAHNVALMDEENHILRPTIHWSDTRSIQQCDFLKNRYQDTIFKITYHQPNPSWTLAQLLWLKENEPGTWKKLRHIQVTKDYVRLRFTGEYATDVYDAIGTQLYYVEKACWSEEICDILGLPTSFLPVVLSAVSLAGVVNESAACDTGLLAGTPVAVGSGDSIVEAFGVGAVTPGQSVVKIATSATVCVVTNSPNPTMQTITYPHVIGESWYSIAATNCGASTMRWFKDTFLQAEEKQTEKDGRSIYSLIDDLSEKVPAGCEGLIFHPYLMGERTPYWDPLLRGNFVGISAHHTLGHFARAIMEGVAYSLRDCYDVIQKMASSITGIFMIGGGTKSPVWSQVICDVIGIPLSKPVMDDAAYGSALLAGVAVGRFDGSLETISKLARIEKQYLPNPERHALYDRYFEIYRTVTRQLAESDHNLAKISREDYR